VSRGVLKVYLGAAPGVGKTCAMLAEGARLAARGTDVVVAAVDVRGRAGTLAAVGDLTLVPPRPPEAAAELDLRSVLRRAPSVALVDDLARAEPTSGRAAPSGPGARDPGRTGDVVGRRPRWEEVQDLLAAGIDVISTVDVQDLQSLADVVHRITGHRPSGSVPDGVVRRVAQLELVDLSPEALRRRLADGEIVAPGQVDAALADYFRPGNLTALRELALLWMADRVDESLRAYRADHGVRAFWETRERVVVALKGSPGGELLVRRAARIAARGAADLLAVHVSGSADLGALDPGALATQRALVESLGGTFHQLVADDVSASLLSFLHAQDATQLVLGAGRRATWRTAVAGPTVGDRVLRGAGHVDVHLIGAQAGTDRGRLPRLGGGLTTRRRVSGAALTAALLPALTLVLVHSRAQVNFAGQLLAYLLAVVMVALVGGLWPALAAAVGGTLLVNWYFTPPFHTWTIAEANNVVAIVGFVVVAAAVSGAVDVAARRTRLAARAGAESQTLSVLAGTVLQGGAALPSLLDRARETFAMSAVSLLEQDGSGWRLVASSGPSPSTSPAEADETAPAGPSLLLALRGRTLAPQDHRVLVAFAAQAAAALAQQRLARAAEAIRPLEQADRMRTALLAAVSHDLRTPLAAAKAAVASLAGEDVEWSRADEQELLSTATESLERLTRLVDNLLDMSRLQAGALSVFPRPVAADEVVVEALLEDPARGVVDVDVPDELPEVLADPALLVRVVANLVDNALRYSPPGVPPRAAISTHAGRVEIRVVDRGPGIPAAAREQVFTPFQRLGDTDNTTGVGLGLALARGLTEAMDGSLRAEDTPGGGLTMTVSLPAAGPASALIPGARERELSGGLGSDPATPRATERGSELSSGLRGGTSGRFGPDAAA